MDVINDEWLNLKIKKVIDLAQNSTQRYALNFLMEVIQDHVTRAAIELLVVDENHRRHLLESVPLRLPFYSSYEKIKYFNQINAKYAFDMFGVQNDGTFTCPNHAEYFLAKCLVRLQCDYMAPTDGVRAFLF